jgi:hypothetical protein
MYIIQSSKETKIQIALKIADIVIDSNNQNNLGFAQLFTHNLAEVFNCGLKNTL